MRLPDGKDAPATLFGKASKFLPGGSTALVPLLPGADHTITVPVSRLFDMTLSGRHEVSVSAFVLESLDPKAPWVKVPTGVLAVDVQ